MTQELITMTQKELSRYEIIKKLIEGKIDEIGAAKQLNLSKRQTRRLKAKVKKHGIKGVIHGNRGKESNRRISNEKNKEIKEIVKDKYYDFGPTFASEKLEENHQIKIGKERLRQLMIEWNLWKPKPRKKNKEYRRWRERKEQYGEMEQFDGSYGKWFEDRAPICCLLASIDDATGNITDLRFRTGEGIPSVFAFWIEYVKENGKPLNIYLDRHSTYKKNHKSVFDDPNCLTQFEGAMKDLNTNIIHARSPQAKGRAERLFGALQDRLIKELRLANISTIEEANKFVKEVFIPKFNQKFAVLPQKKGNLHRKLTKIEEKNLDKIFSIQNTRIVNNDFTVRYKGKWFQLSQTQPTLVLRKDKVLIEERINGEIFISLRDKYLNYIVLPKRPEKVKMKVVGLTRAKPLWKPPANHPWRRPFLIPNKKVESFNFKN